MARSQGVKDVIQRSYADGELVKDVVVKRVVYQRANGTLYVRDHDRQKDITTQPDGQLVIWYEAKSKMNRDFWIGIAALALMPMLAIVPWVCLWMQWID